MSEGNRIQLGFSGLTQDYQQYYFTYSYGNGDNYSGYGYALAGTYAAGQVLGGYTNETGYDGSYTIDYVSSGYDSSYDGQVYVTSYYDGDTGYGLTTNIVDGAGSYDQWFDGIHGYSGLGSEYAHAYDANGGYSFDVSFGGGYYEADILGSQLYNFTYYYGNGDNYSGYGYSLAGNYSTGQNIIASYPNETGYFGS